MKRKGFTLMELVIVIIILGILATIGFRQYAVTIEKAKGAEARNSIGSIRMEAYEFYLRNSETLTPLSGNFADADAGIGAGAGLLPGPAACSTAYDFMYSVSNVVATSFTATATRCTAGGKTNLNAAVLGAGPHTVTLNVNLGTGADVWAGTGVFR